MMVDQKKPLQDILFHAVALVVFVHRPVQCHSVWFSSRAVTFVVEYFTLPGSIRERPYNSCSLYLAIADIFLFFFEYLVAYFSEEVRLDLGKHCQLTLWPLNSEFP